MSKSTPMLVRILPPRLVIIHEPISTDFCATSDRLYSEPRNSSMRRRSFDFFTRGKGETIDRRVPCAANLNLVENFGFPPGWIASKPTYRRRFVKYLRFCRARVRDTTYREKNRAFGRSRSVSQRVYRWENRIARYGE